MMITALLGVYTYQIKHKSDVTKGKVADAQTAIDGLATLADKHQIELGRNQADITRMDARYEDCETRRVALLERVARLDGQVTVLQAQAAAAVPVAAAALQAAALVAAEQVQAAAVPVAAAVQAVALRAKAARLDAPSSKVE